MSRDPRLGREEADAAFRERQDGQLDTAPSGGRLDLDAAIAGIFGRAKYTESRNGPVRLPLSSRPGPAKRKHEVVYDGEREGRRTGPTCQLRETGDVQSAPSTFRLA